MNLWTKLFGLYCCIIIVSSASCPPKLVKPSETSKHVHAVSSQCSKPYKKMVSISYTSVYYTSCWSITSWFKCKKTRRSYRKVERTFYNKIKYTYKECVDGYKLNATKMCVPYCDTCKHGRCVAPYTCQCYDGYIGKKCEAVCPVDKYGTNCTLSCNCKNNAICSNIDGSCNCTAGWKGESCGTPCNKKSYGYYCEQKCMCINGATCNPVTGKCACKRGYIGENCGQICPQGKYDHNCQRNCTCHNGATCRFYDGVCNCTAGWMGASCSLPCKNGFYGSGCSKGCGCSNSDSCNPFNGSCICVPGFFGEKCQFPCNNTYGKHCSYPCKCNTSNTDSCDNVDGTCNCKPNWNGATCSNPCSTTVGNADGNQTTLEPCQKVCNCTVGQGKCQNTTGLCLCHPGYNGTQCEIKCKPGTFGVNCKEKCKCAHAKSCNITTGYCNCKAGWTGQKCNTACDYGLFGENCQQSCSCSIHGICDHFNGTCACNDEYQNKNCSFKCSDDDVTKWKFGLGCNKTCLCNQTNTESCHGMSGKCTCKTGWEPPYCHKKQSCNGTHYGKDCLELCNCDLNHGVCDSVTGACTCKSGYYGTDCRSQCATGYYGQDCASTCTCQNNAVCNHVNGKCNCSEGFMGAACDIPCKEGYYGRRCESQCHCQNEATCDRFTGKCHCRRPGWTGDKCNTSCRNWSYGLNCLLRCSCPKNNTDSCDPTNGNCVCKSGFNGTDCSEICIGGYWGSGCVYKCGCHEQNSNISKDCDVQSGQCACLKGFHGRTCDKTCNGTHFGDGCLNKCPCNGTHATGLCHHVTGQCNCQAGYTGFLCNETCPVNKYGVGCEFVCSCDDCDPVDGCAAKRSQIMKIYVPAGVVCLVVLVLLIAAFILWKRRSTKKDKLNDKKFNQSITKKELMKNEFQLQGATNTTYDDNDGTYQDVNHHKPNPIYESNVDNLQNPIYSSTQDPQSQYDTLFKKKQLEKNSSSGYAHLGTTASKAENNYDSLHDRPTSTQSNDQYNQLNFQQHGHDNVHANLIYGSVDTGANHSSYDSLCRNQQPNAATVDPCYDHIGNQTLANQNNSYDSLDQSSSKKISLPEESEYAVANVGMYNSLSNNVKATSPSDIFAAGEQYNTLHNTQNNQERQQTYDHLAQASEYEIPNAQKSTGDVSARSTNKAGKKEKKKDEKGKGKNKTKEKKKEKQGGRVRYSSLDEEKNDNNDNMYAVVEKKK